MMANGLTFSNRSMKRSTLAVVKPSSLHQDNVDLVCISFMCISLIEMIDLFLDIYV